MVLFLTVKSCAGSVGLCYLLELNSLDNTLLLSFVAVSTILANAPIIAQYSMKVIVASF